MAGTRQRRNVAYSLGQPLSDLSPHPIVASRAPTTADKAEVGTTWINTTTDGVWILSSIKADVAAWADVNVSEGAIITSGDLVVVAGDIDVTAGDVDVAAGDINVTLGDIEATAGAITAGTTLDAGTTVTAGTGISATTGDITADAGNFVATLGDVTVSAGDIDVTLGDVDVAAGNVNVLGGNVDVLYDVEARGVFVRGDEGTGSAGELLLTNTTDTTVSTGAGKVLMKTANPQDSIGWLKIYVGTDVRYLPMWANLSP